MVKDDTNKIEIKNNILAIELASQTEHIDVKKTLQHNLLLLNIMVGDRKGTTPAPKSQPSTYSMITAFTHPVAGSSLETDENSLLYICRDFTVTLNLPLVQKAGELLSLYNANNTVTISPSEIIMFI